MQSFATALAFWYAPVLSLYWQLLIAVVFDVFGTLCFCTVEWRRSRLANCHEAEADVINGRF